MLDRYFVADVKIDQTEVSSMILPKDLGTAKKIILDAISEAESKEIDVFALLQPDFEDVGTMDEMRQIDSLTLYAKIGEWAMKALPEIYDDVIKEKFQVIGLIDESPNSKYVIIRRTGANGSYIISKIVVFQNDRRYSSLEGQWMKIQAAVFSCLAVLHLRGER
ncbi:MAG: hypothetical protein WBP29_11735 [Candidatus Zixiibacteriota bacterium]